MIVNSFESYEKNFFGGKVEKVGILFSGIYSESAQEMFSRYVENNFCRLRNFAQDESYNKVACVPLKSQNVDAIVIATNCGRFISKKTYQRIASAMSEQIPVYFKRLPSFTDVRRNTPIWSTDTLVRMNPQKMYQCSSPYFMQIPSISDFIINEHYNNNNELYALLPAMA